MRRPSPLLWRSSYFSLRFADHRGEKRAYPNSSHRREFISMVLRGTLVTGSGGEESTVVSSAWGRCVEALRRRRKGAEDGPLFRIGRPVEVSVPACPDVPCVHSTARSPNPPDKPMCRQPGEPDPNEMVDRREREREREPMRAMTPVARCSGLRPGVGLRNSPAMSPASIRSRRPSRRVATSWPC